MMVAFMSRRCRMKRAVAGVGAKGKSHADRPAEKRESNDKPEEASAPNTHGHQLMSGSTGDQGFTIYCVDALLLR
jgi:hypothetical protein